MFGMGPILTTLPIRPDAEGEGMEAFVTEIDEQLWFEYLAVSPSYELARQHHHGALSPKAKLPPDFDQVLSVYANLGDVQDLSFRNWWRLRGSRHLQAENERSSVMRLGTLSRDQPSDADFDVALDDYRNGPWVRQGTPDTLIVAIPKNLHASVIHHQIKQLIDWRRPQEAAQMVNQPTYRLAGKRIHSDTLLRYLYVLYFRACLPKKEEGWRIGAHTHLSSMHSRYIDPVLDEPNSNNEERRRILGIVTSRAVRNARLISENAARGIFPSHKDCPGALEFDFTELRERMVLRDRRRIEAACRKRGITPDQYKGRQLEKLVKLLPHAE